jgi:Adenylate and Guanylate cyclase catalytic domain
MTQVTILFADLKGSLELLADRDPEEARQILDPVLEGMMEAVHRYEGTVNQVMGDGIMALFGAPLAHEDAARIDRLPLEEKQLLQSAAVIGTDVPLVLLQEIAVSSADDLQRGLGHLQEAKFLYETRLLPDPEYTFKHALTHDVAYSGLLHERRRLLHRRVGQAIETRYAGRLVEFAEMLANQFERGEDWAKIVHY